MTHFYTQQHLLSHMLLHSMDNPQQIGLLTGQMGIVLVIEEYSRQWKCPWLEVAADYIYDNIAKRICNMYDIGFSSGLSGIGWGVEYLVQHNFMPGPADEICKEVDTRIMQSDIHRIKDTSATEGMLGLFAYVQSRILGNVRSGLGLPFDSEYLTGWLNVLTTNPECFHVEYHWLKRALSGDIELCALKLSKFITVPHHIYTNELSLTKGIAAHIAHNFLNL